MSLARAKSEGWATGSEQPRFARHISDDYKVLARTASRGKSGRVWHATHEKTGRCVTVKTFGLQATYPGARNIVYAGLVAHGKLDHKHIVNILDVYVSHFAVHVVMELLEGGDLCAALAQRGKFSEEETKVVLRQLIMAVDHMHQNNIVHRDIKLESIMYTKLGGNSVKLIDFGLATQWDGITDMSLQRGSPEFSAPEMMRSVCTEKADIWSIGVVTYMLLTGEPLYNGSEWEIQARAKAGTPQLCDAACSAGAQDFVRSLLAHNPVLRPSAEGALSHPWLS